MRMSIICNEITATLYSEFTELLLYLYAKSCHEKSTAEKIPNGIVLHLGREISQGRCLSLECCGAYEIFYYQSAY